VVTRPAAAGDDQLALDPERPLARRLVRRGGPDFVVDVVVELVERDQAVLVAVGLAGLKAGHQRAGEDRG